MREDREWRGQISCCDKLDGLGRGQAVHSIRLRSGKCAQGCVEGRMGMREELEWRGQLPCWDKLDGLSRGQADLHRSTHGYGCGKAGV